MNNDLTHYGSFLSESGNVDFDSDDVPITLRDLIPCARFWGICDDLERERLVEKAPDNVKESLQQLIINNEDALDDWLAGAEATAADPTDAYIAFSAMRMAVDYM